MSKLINKVEIYTDGSVSIKNNNKCAWAFVVYINNEFVYEDSALLTEDHRTGNIAEMSAIINSLIWLENSVTELGLLHFNFEVNVYSDSQYCVKGINEWIHKWKMKYYQGVKNRKYWELFYDLKYKTKFGYLSINWIKGHSGIEGNERADKLCNLLTTK